MNWNELLCNERPNSSKVSDDHREQFERDYDRAVFSSPVKRLQDKAQVFPLERNDSVRTRLTHSLEVSSVARGLVRNVCQLFLEKELSPGQDRQIEAIAATCGLLHDLGNPPFGHSGEDAIQTWFQAWKESNTAHPKLEDLLKTHNNKAAKSEWLNDFLHFEGNAQTLRIVSKLQILAKPNGLNLTFGTLSALCKYTASSSVANKLSKNHAETKPGYFSSEIDCVNTIRKKTGIENARNPITYLVEAADDIVYSVCDIEDGIKKRIITWETLLDLLNSAPENTKTCIASVLELKDRILSLDNGSSKFSDDIHGSAFRTAMIAKLVPSVALTFKTKYDEIMSGQFTQELLAACDMADLVAQLKGIGRKYIYCTHENLKLELMGRKIIHDLLTLFWEGAKELPLDENTAIKTRQFSGKLQALISESFRRVFRDSVAKNPELPENYYRLQLVTDQVCGMTDTYAKQLHAELTNG